jgi:hypothetical protein
LSFHLASGPPLTTSTVTTSTATASPITATTTATTTAVPTTTTTGTMSATVAYLISHANVLTPTENKLIATDVAIQNALAAAAVSPENTGAVANGLATNTAVQPVVIADLTARKAALTPTDRALIIAVPEIEIALPFVLPGRQAKTTVQAGDKLKERRRR